MPWLANFSGSQHDILYSDQIGHVSYYSILLNKMLIVSGVIFAKPSLYIVFF